MSRIDLAGIRRRQERGVRYWQLQQPEWAAAQEPELASYSRAAYLGVIRDIPALLDELEQVTRQRNEAWTELDLGDAS